MLFPTHYVSKPPVDAQLIRGHPLAKGLVGAWLFNEGSGLKAFDLSGNNNYGSFGTGTETPTWRSNSLNFDGIDDYINCGNNESLNITNAITIWAWIKMDTAPTFSQVVGRNDWSKRILIDEWRRVYVQMETSHISTDLITLGAWQHIAYTSNGTISHIYINGKEDSGGAGSDGADFSSVTDLLIGQSVGDSYPFDGEIKEIGICNRMSNANEIAQLYINSYCMFAQPMEAELFYAYVPYPHLSGLSGGISEAIAGGISR